MGFCPLVKPDVTRVTLKNGEWLDLKKELNAGEYRAIFVDQFKDTVAGEKLTVDLRRVGISQILVYVAEWSFVNFDGTPLPIREDWLLKFNNDTFTEIRQLVEAHHEATEKAVEERKNALAGAASN